MELLATGNSICCPDLLYGDVVLLEFIHKYMYDYFQINCNYNFSI